MSALLQDDRYLCCNACLQIMLVTALSCSTGFVSTHYFNLKALCDYKTGLHSLETAERCRVKVARP